MNWLLDTTSATWFAGPLLLAGLLLAVLALRRPAGRRAGFLAWGVGLVLAGVGGLALPRDTGSIVAAVAAFGLLVLSGALFAGGAWSRNAARLFGAALALGLGSLLVPDASADVHALGIAARSLEVVEPFWLLLLLVLPVLVLVSYRSLAGLGPVRRWVAIGLRAALVALLVLALAEVRVRRPVETLTVLFVVDRSLSIPPDIDPNAPTNLPESERDRRWARVRDFINASVRGRPDKRDAAGVIVFGKRPRLALPPSTVDKLYLADEMTAGLDFQYTDIAAALKLALASFPEGSGKRVVLLSDGNENLGNAEEQARSAKYNGVQIDVVPLAAGYRNENEVLVERVEAPPLTEQGSRLPIRVLVRNASPNRDVVGMLVVKQISEGHELRVPILPGPGVLPGSTAERALVRLRPGLNAFSFRQTLAGENRSYTYEATFTPLETIDERTDERRAGLPGDRIQNNTASTHVVALGRRKVLFVEPNGHKGEHRFLIDRLNGAGETKFRIASVTAGELPAGKTDLGVFLSNFDCVVLANVPAEELSDDQQEMLRSNTADQGCGLVMIGGPESFGAGGYGGTAVEKALPVDCDIKSLKVTGKGGLVLIMHASEMAQGNHWQKEIAKLAIKKLAPNDMVGLLYYDFKNSWHIPFQTVGEQRARLLGLVDKMSPGDMPDFDPFLKDAYNTLTNPKYELATKHVILISDGDPAQANQKILADMKAAKVTCTTVGVATHGAPENQRMENIAKSTGGRFYNPTNPKQLPAIYIKETRIVSQSFVYDKRFQPQLRLVGGPTEKLPADLPPLYGFVRTSLKESALAQMGIEGPSTLDQKFPILAYWQYGLGKAVAFTSDARTQEAGKQGWDRDWAKSDLYQKFWEQVIGWALRGVESGRLNMTTEYRDGKVKVTVDARDGKNKPITNLELEGRVTLPGQPGNVKPVELKFVQRASGQYEAEFKAEEAGSYFVNALAKRKVPVLDKQGKPVLDATGKPKEAEEIDSVRAGVTMPYSPEFADLESNAPLLKRLADQTGGRVYPEETLGKGVAEKAVFRPAPAGTRSLQPIWYWLLLVAGFGLLADVAVRRVAVDPAQVAAAVERWWERRRGRLDRAAQTPQFLDRLRNVKAQVGEAIDRGRPAARRFELPPGATAPPPPGADAGMAPPASRPAPPRPAAPPPSPGAAGGQTGDYFARLRKAKEQQKRERDKPPEGGT